MGVDDHAKRVATYVRRAKEEGKPMFSPDRDGTYIAFSGLELDGSRRILIPEYHGPFGNAIDLALKMPEFYAHHLNIEQPFDLNPASLANGYVHDLLSHRICMYTDGMKNEIKPVFDLSGEGQFKIFSGQVDFAGGRRVLEERFEGNGFDVVSRAIQDPGFYAHALNSCFPVCDHPANFRNGYIEMLVA